MFRRPIMALLAGLALTAGSLAADSTNDESLQKLRLAKFVMPEFPEIIRASGESRGVVTVAIGRDAEGLVNDVLVLDSTHARLTVSVVEAVKQWKFARPANLQPPGKPIVPIVRFLFGARGVVMVPTISRGLGSKDGERIENAPVMLPSFADLDSEPKPLNHPQPKFTPATAERLEGGSATVKFFVDETGKVRVPIVLECTTPEFGLAAAAAVEQWTYEPPMMSGRPTIAVVVATVTFAKPKG